MPILCFYLEQIDPLLDSGENCKHGNAGNLFYNLNWSSSSSIPLNKFYIHTLQNLKKMFKKKKKENILVWQPQHKTYNKMAKLRWLGAYPEEAINAPAWANISVPFL